MGVWLAEKLVADLLAARLQVAEDLAASCWRLGDFGGWRLDVVVGSLVVLANSRSRLGGLDNGFRLARQSQGVWGREQDGYGRGDFLKNTGVLNFLFLTGLLTLPFPPPLPILKLRFLFIIFVCTARILDFSVFYFFYEPSNGIYCSELQHHFLEVFLFFLIMEEH